MQKEIFKSRLGFVLVAAGCAIGLGNVWKFPYMCGAYGGAAFILAYFVFLAFLGIPVLILEISVGRASGTSIATSYQNLEPQGSQWHLLKWLGILGNYMLMMFYTMVGGWMLYYCVKGLTGAFNHQTLPQIVQQFTSMLASPGVMTFWTVVVGVICLAICSLGLRKGVENITVKMMVALLLIMIVLAGNSLLLEGSGKGIEFYLVPDLEKIRSVGLGTILYGAMNQAFFTLSIGIGCMQIFGCSLTKKSSITNEAFVICALDTYVALMAGFIIIPACFAFGIRPDAGPSLIFITLPNIFTRMASGQFWGFLFFLFMTFAAMSTIIAVYENIITFGMEMFGWSRKKSTVLNGTALLVLSLPCVFGFNIWSGFHPLGPGSTVLDLEDFIVSTNILPLGSLGYALFCTRKHGWGWQSFLEEVNTGEGRKFPAGLKLWVAYGIPAIISIIFLKSYYDTFKGLGTTTLTVAMLVALLILGTIFKIGFTKAK